MQAALAELTGPGFEYTAPLEALYSNLGWHIWIYENRSVKLRLYHNLFCNNHDNIILGQIILTNLG